MGRLLSDAPIGRFRAPTVRLAIGLAYSQIETLTGFPRTTEVNVVTSIVRGHSGLFFSRLGDAPAIPNVVQRRDGTFMAAAMDSSAVAATMSALRQHGFRRFTAVPCEAAIAAIAVTGAHVVADDGIGVRLTVGERGCLEQVCRLSGPCNGDVKTESHALGFSTVELLSAYGAVVGAGRTAFVWRPPLSFQRTRTTDRVWVAGAVALVALSVSSAVVVIERMR